jgi:hypothetical protein
MDSETISLISAGIALFAAAGAWGAVLANRRNTLDTISAQTNIGARTSRASVVSANRQKWIDAIRDDVAEFIAVRSQMGLIAASGSMQPSGQDMILAEARELRNRAVMLRSRVDMRLNHAEDDHIALLKALGRYDVELSEDAESELRAIARRIFKAEWERLKKEAAGIDPFVRGSTPAKQLAR